MAEFTKKLQSFGLELVSPPTLKGWLNGGALSNFYLKSLVPVRHRPITQLPIYLERIELKIHNPKTKYHLEFKRGLTPPWLSHVPPTPFTNLTTLNGIVVGVVNTPKIPDELYEIVDSINFLKVDDVPHSHSLGRDRIDFNFKTEYDGSFYGGTNVILSHLGGLNHFYFSIQLEIDLSKVENPVHKDIIARLIESEKKSSFERIDVLDKTLATLRPPVKPPRKVVLGTSTAMAETIASEKAPEPTLGKDFPVNETFGRNKDSLLDSILEITSRSADTNSIKMKKVVMELVSRGIMDESEIPVIPEETENPYYYTLFSPEKYYKAIMNSKLDSVLPPDEFVKIQGILRPLSLPYGIGKNRKTHRQRKHSSGTQRKRRHRKA